MGPRQSYLTRAILVEADLHRLCGIRIKAPGLPRQQGKETFVHGVCGTFLLSGVS